MDFVSIIMSNKDSYETMQKCVSILDLFGVKYELIISSAYRSPQRTRKYIKEVEKKGAKVFIAVAGMGAQLAGTIAATTTKPVIGVPMKDKAGALDGMDAMLSTVQTPAGMPVATVALGEAGAKNAAYLAMQILAITDRELAVKLKEDRVVKEQRIVNESKDIEVIL
jgi:5-(carboxyamino)imidazole ribonucleotide mutase